MAAIKFETARIHFLSDVFVVVTYLISSLDERSAVERSTRGDGKDERGESFSFLLSFSPSSRDLPVTAKRRLRTSQLPYSILDDYK